MSALSQSERGLVVRTLDRIPEIAEALREIEEGLRDGRSRDEIARHLGVSQSELHRIETHYRGMNHDQLERVLDLESEVQSLRDELERLQRDADQGAHGWLRD